VINLNLNLLDQYVPNNFVRALIILVGLFIVLRATVFVIERVVLKLASKTKTDLDDLIIQKSSKPITTIIFFVGLRFALEEIILNEATKEIVFKITSSLIVVTVIYLAYAILSLILIRGWKRFNKNGKSNSNIEGLVRGTMKVVLFIVCFLYVLNYWGVEIGPVLTGLGIGGIAVALALQSSLSNLFGGVSVIFDKTIRVGDLISLDDGTKGTVMHVGLRSTQIKTADEEMVIIPNGKLADSKIKNVTLPEPLVRVVIPFSVAYGNDVNKIKKIVLEEIKQVKHLVNEPKPSIMFKEMGDSALKFEAYIFIDSYDNKLSVVDEANTRIYNLLRKNKIEIPYSKMDIYMKK